MNDEINYKNNPLHGVSLKNLLIEIVDHYGFEILYAYLNINCFKANASIESSVKFLKKTDWAREKVEAFYLYQFKSLPRASDAQFELPPRDRIIPDGQTPGEPSALSLEDAERLREKRERKAADHRPSGRRNTPPGKSPYPKGRKTEGSASSRREPRPHRSDANAPAENPGNSLYGNKKSTSSFNTPRARASASATPNSPYLSTTHSRPEPIKSAATEPTAATQEAQNKPTKGKVIDPWAKSRS